MKYWKTNSDGKTGGFYLTSVEDSIEITDEYWQELLDGQSNGKQITSDENGYPILVDPPLPTQAELDAQEIVKLKQYLSDTDYIYPKCLELDLDVTYVYPDIIQKRKDARIRIQELE